MQRRKPVLQGGIASELNLNRAFQRTIGRQFDPGYAADGCFVGDSGRNRDKASAAFFQKESLVRGMDPANQPKGTERSPGIEIDLISTELNHSYL